MLVLAAVECNVSLRLRDDCNMRAAQLPDPRPRSREKPWRTLHRSQRVLASALGSRAESARERRITLLVRHTQRGRTSRLNQTAQQRGALFPELSSARTVRGDSIRL